MKKRSYLICFIGVDGSGKSTLADILNDKMNEDGINCRHEWCGWREFDSFLLKPFAKIARKLLLRKKGTDNSFDIYNDASINWDNSTYLRLFLPYLIMVDYLITTFIKVRVPLFLGRSIVCDRYFYDIIIMLNHNRIVNTFLNLLPKPDFTFLVDISEEIAFKRKGDIPSVEFLAKNRQLYLDVVKQRVNKEKYLVIDGSGKIDDIKEHILDELTVIFEGNQLSSGVVE